MGFWSTSNDAVASINDQGVVTSATTGTTEILFTESSNGCTSEPFLVEVLAPDDSNCIVATKENVTANITIYPNPTSQILYLESIDIIQSIRLLSTNGGEIYHDKPIDKNKLQIDVSTFSSGMYILEARCEKDVYYSKVFVE